MMKFFRKHNKKLLAVFMVLLMVVFLGGSALNRLLQSSGNRVVARSSVGDVSFLDHRIAEDTTSILAALGLDWKRPVSGAAEPLDTTDWILLTREARKLGMAGDPATVRSTLPATVRIDDLSRQLRKKPDRILAAIAEFDAVQRTALAVAGASAPSEADVLAAARATLEKVRINAVLLPAEVFVDHDAEFTDAQIESRFKQYREREPGPGLAFGYYVGPAVKVQYIKIDRDVIAEQLRAKRIKHLARKARRYYEKQRETDPAFRRPPEETGEQSEEALEGPPYEPPPYLYWDEARDVAIEIVSRQEADETVSQLAGWLDQHLSEEWLGAESDEGGYRKAPEGVARLAHYDKVIARIPPTIAFPEAVSTGVTDFFNEEQADDVEPLGKAVFRPKGGGAVQRLRTLAFRTKDVVPSIPNEKGISASDFLSPFQTCRYALTDAEGNTYLFRVVAARQGHIPDSVDEVRERVVGDLRLLAGYEAAKARAESLRSCAADMSLEEAYESDEELLELLEGAPEPMGGYFEPPAFARRGRFQVAQSRSTDSVFVGGGVGFIPIAAAERCFALKDAPEKTMVIELEDQAKVMVVEWLETQLADGDEFVTMREQFVQQLARARSRDAVADWLKPEQIRARNGFEIVTD